MSANSAVLLTLTRERYAQKNSKINTTLVDETYEISSTLATAVSDTVQISGKADEISDAELEIWAKANPEIAQTSIFAPEETTAVSQTDNNSKILVTGTTSSLTPEKVTQDTKVSDMSESQQTNIKTIIWLLHHPTTPGAGGTEGTEGGEGTGSGSGTEGTEGGEGTGSGTEGTEGGEGTGSGTEGGEGEGGEGEGGETPTTPKTTFIKASYNKFDDTTTMFNYISTVDSSVTTSTGISRSQLVALTQNDKKEDENLDFFGSINRLFYKLDTNKDGTLSFAEIQAFIGEEIGTEAEFRAKVQSYSQALENEYQAMTAQQKFNFVLERTREYLDAAGLRLQKEALIRLTNGTNSDSSAIHSGNISFEYVNTWDLNHNYRIDNATEAQLYEDYYGEAPDYNAAGNYYYNYYITNGSYTSYSYQGQWSNSQASNNNVTIYGSDSDYYDPSDVCSTIGIALDIKYLNDSNYTWVELVDVLVHELTHATMPLYYTDSEEGILNNSAIDLLDRYTNIDNATITSLKTHWNNWSHLTLKDIGITQAHMDALYNYVDGSLCTDDEYNNWETLSLNEISYYTLNVIQKSWGSSLTGLNWSDRMKLYYLITTACGEYVAYQTDADYLDSVAGDIYNSGETTACDGASEKSVITAHVQAGYDKATGVEARPDWEWKTYVA